jgi:hypothetical protein
MRSLGVTMLSAVICLGFITPRFTLFARDLAQYDRGGKIELSWQDGRSAQSGRLRDFLWKHWLKQKRGFITVMGHSIEGASSLTTFFVEPDKQGRWCVAAEMKYEEMRHPDNIEEGTSSYEAYSVKRVKPDIHDPASRVAIPTNARVSAQSYRLLLLDREGKEITQL